MSRNTPIARMTPAFRQAARAPNAPPAVRAAYNSDLGSAFNFDTNAAKAAGTLGGYGDEWFNSGLGEQAAARTIGAGNSIAEEDKSVIQPEQQLASIEAYRPPSIWGQILQGGGNLLGAYSGTHASPTVPSCPSAPAACSRRRHPRCSARTPAATRPPIAASSPHNAGAAGAGVAGGAAPPPPGPQGATAARTARLHSFALPPGIRSRHGRHAHQRASYATRGAAGVDGGARSLAAGRSAAFPLESARGQLAHDPPLQTPA
jgi:hypothetical protein